MARPKSPLLISIFRGVYELDLTPNEKFVLSNIGNVITSGGIYQFDNEWITTFTKVSKRQVSTIIRNLVSEGFIEVELIHREGTKEILKRVVKLPPRGMEVCNPTSRSRLPGGTEVDFLDNRKPLLNSKDNRKGLSERKEEFIKETRSFKEYSEHHDAFIEYFSEPNKSETKMLFEIQPTWNTKSRLSRWASRDFNRGTKKSKINGKDVLSPIIREIQRVGSYKQPEFSDEETDAKKIVRMIGWGRCCSLSEYDLKQEIGNKMSMFQ